MPISFGTRTAVSWGCSCFQILPPGRAQTPLYGGIAIRAAEVRHQSSMPMADGPIAATCMVVRGSCVSDDPYFESVEELSKRWIQAAEGRSALRAALSSRYTPLTSFGIAGLYFLAVSLSEKSSLKGRSFGFHALLAVMFFGLIVSYGVGWQAGETWSHSREMGAYVIKTYRKHGKKAHDL